MKSSPTAAPDRLEDLDREAHPVVERAAVAVAALVDERRPELVDEVAVGLELETVEAALPAAPRRLAERAHDPPDVGLLHLLGEAPVGGLADRRGRDRRQPVAVVPDRPPAQVGELDHRRRAVRVHPVGQLLEPRDDVVVAGVELAEDRRRVRRDVRRAAEHRQGDPALRLLLVVELVAQLRLAVLGVGRLVAGLMIRLRSVRCRSWNGWRSGSPDVIGRP